MKRLFIRIFGLSIYVVIAKHKNETKFKEIHAYSGLRQATRKYKEFQNHYGAENVCMASRYIK